jgi:hypothetical protein
MNRIGVLISGIPIILSGPLPQLVTDHWSLITFGFPSASAIVGRTDIMSETLPTKPGTL